MSTTEYERFTEDFHAHFTRDPNACVALGVMRNLDRLPDPGADEAFNRVSDARRLVTRAAELRLGGEPRSFDQRLDLDLATLTLEREVHGDTYTFNDRTRAQQLPEAGEQIGEGLLLLFANDPRPAADRLADITARVEGVPDYLEAMLGRLETPVTRWVAIEQQTAEGLPELLQSLDDWAAAEGFADLRRLRRAREAAAPALASYLERLAAMETTDALHLGDATARQIVALRGIDSAIETLHGTARQFLAETAEQIEDLRQRLVAKLGLAADISAAELHAELKRRHRVSPGGAGLDGVLQRYELERQKVLEFVTAGDLFPICADQQLKLLRTPPFLEPTIPAGAMMPPPAFRDGVKTSLVYLTLSEALLDEHTELSIPSMMIHEGIPGHHLQLATAAHHPSVVRRHVDALEHAEGWTTMLEEYMLDQGYMGELTDEARFCGKRDLCRIGVRVAIDLFFMTGDRGSLDVGVDFDRRANDPFEAAGSLLGAVTGFTPGRVQAELNWYSLQSGYPLCYLTGNRMVRQLKADLREHNGDRLSAESLDDHTLDREFHRIYLESGNMPLSFLRRVFEQAELLPPRYF